MDIKKTERINNLLDLYGELLTTEQKEVMDMYYSYDLSLAEIAEDTNTSRSAVYDLIKRSSDILNDYEAKLGLLAKRERVIELVKDLNENLKEEILKNV